MKAQMSKNSSIAIIGAGAVGIALFCSLRARDVDCDLIGRDSRPRLFTLRTPDASYVYCSESTEEKRYDIVVSAVKRYDSVAVAEVCASRLKQNGRLLTVQNGLSIEKDYTPFVERNKILNSLLYACVERADDCTSVLKNSRLLLCVEDTDSARSLRDIFQTPEIEMQLVHNIRYESWKKIIVSSSLSAVCAYVRSDVAEVYAQPDSLDLLRKLLAEGVTLYNALYDDGPMDLSDLEDSSEANRVDFKPSLYIDLMKGKENELDWLNGRLLQEAKTLGLSLPMHQHLYQDLRNRSRD